MTSFRRRVGVVSSFPTGGIGLAKNEGETLRITITLGHSPRLSFAFINWWLVDILTMPRYLNLTLPYLDLLLVLVEPLLVDLFCLLVILVSPELRRCDESSAESWESGIEVGGQAAPRRRPAKLESRSDQWRLAAEYIAHGDVVFWRQSPEPLPPAATPATMFTPNRRFGVWGMDGT